MAETADAALQNLERMLGRDPLLKDLMAGNAPQPRKAGRFTPAVDVLQGEGLYRVVIDVPGIPKELLDVELDGGRLIIRGRRPRKPDTMSVRSAERGTGAFERVFLLPGQSRGDLVEAELDHGVLTVTVPVGEGHGRKVEIGEKG